MDLQGPDFPLSPQVKAVLVQVTSSTDVPRVTGKGFHNQSKINQLDCTRMSKNDFSHRVVASVLCCFFVHLSHQTFVTQWDEHQVILEDSSTSTSSAGRQALLLPSHAQFSIQRGEVLMDMIGLRAEEVLGSMFGIRLYKAAGVLGLVIS